jgi:signal transduction histidine kinase/ligand-binding sensor domain-containing protein
MQNKSGKLFFLLRFSWVMLLVGLVGCHLLHAQSLQSSAATSPTTEQLSYTFEHITAAQGLPQNSVNDIVQDKQGFIWFATQDGLCRYDGYSLKVFRPQSGTPRAMQAGFIFRLFVDSRGQVWTATAGGGLGRYDNTTGNFTIFRHDPTNNQSLPGDNINDICEDADQNLWVAAAESGIACINPTTGLVKRYNFGSVGASSSGEAHARGIIVDKSGIVWVSVFGKGLYSFNPKTATWKFFGSNPQDPKTLHTDKLWYMALDAHGLLWIATREAGIIVFDTKAERVHRVYRHHDDNPLSLSNDNIWEIHQDSEQNLWIATFGGGVNRFDPRTETFQHLRSKPGCPTALASDVILCVFRDREQNLWVGMQLAGVAKSDISARQFGVLRAYDACVGGVLPDAVIRSIYEDKRGRLWVGTNRGGVSVLERSPQGRRVLASMQHDSLRKGTLPHNSVWGITEDNEGNVWLATGGGIALLDAATVQIQKIFTSNPANPRSLGSNTLRTVFKDSRGRVWLGAFAGGLHRYNPSTRDFTRYEPNQNLPESISSGEVRAIIEDQEQGQPNGNLWLGTWGGGLCYFDSERETFTTFRHQELDFASIGSDIVRSLHIDSKDGLWVGTNNGLCRFDKQTRTFRVYREREGLPNNVVYAIQEDAQHRLWLSTNKGLTCFNPVSEKVQIYTARDGLPDNEFNGNVSYKGTDGKLYFGSINGVAIVELSLLENKRALPKVSLTEYKIFNRAVELDTVIEARSRVEVAYKDNFLSLGFAALSFSATNAIQYRYKLEGFDKEWVESGGKREAIYTNLDPGEYVFRVQAQHLYAPWSESGEVRLSLSVIPPWWMTLWFRIVLTVLVLAAAVLVYRLRTAYLREQAQRLEIQVRERTTELQAANQEIHRQLEIQTEQAREIELSNTSLHEMNTVLERQNVSLAEMNTEKNEFLGIVSHDLKNPIGAVRGLADLIHSGFAEGKQIQTISEQIVLTADRMLELVKNLLDVNQLEQGGMKFNNVSFDVAPMVEATLEQYQTAADAKNITLYFVAEAASTLALADEQATTQIFDNIVSNAVKYSPHGKNVFIRLKSSHEAVRVEVQDEGQGISEDDMKKLFGKFARLSARPTGGEHSTGLGLSIVKKMVEAMNGKVWCESELGKGATFIVELPNHP